MNSFQERLKFHFGFVCRLIQIREVPVFLWKERDGMEGEAEHTALTENKDGLVLTVLSAIFISNHPISSLPSALSSLVSPHIYFHLQPEKPRLWAFETQAL